MDTIRLYDQDAYAAEFSAVVMSCEEITREVRKQKETLYAVILDRTLFFPEEGGQVPDKGVIGGVPVADVQIRKGVITHYLRGPLTPGQEVLGKIDWKYRFSNMQQHSGEHIFSGLTHNRFGYDNVGFHLSDQIVTMDFNGPITEEEIAELEWQANEVISSNVEVLTTFPTREELAQMTYRSKIEIEGQVKIITIPDVDCCACCAPHVRRTGEIGLLKVMSSQNYKGGVRISILCGFRALEAFRDKSRVVADLMGILTTGQEQLTASVSKLKSANGEMSTQLAKAKQELLEKKLNAVGPEETDVIFFEQGIDMPIARNAVNQLVEAHEGLCGFFIGSGETGFQFVLASRTRDCKEIAAKLRTELGAKGGGSSRMIQGSVQAEMLDIDRVLRG